MNTENEETEHKTLVKVCKKVANICVLWVIFGKNFTNELNVLWWKFITENKNQRISIESEENWCESNLEELMSVKPIHSDEAYMFSNQILFYKYSFHFESRKKESKL